MIEFLNEGQLGRLAVLEEDGWPYVIPVWYEYSDSGYYIIPRAKSRWPLFVRPVRYNHLAGRRLGAEVQAFKMVNGGSCRLRNAQITTSNVVWVSYEFDRTNKC